MKAKLPALLLIIFSLSSSFIVQPSVQLEKNLKVNCCPYIADVINVASSATITQTTLSGCAPGSDIDFTDITFGNQISYNLTRTTATLRIDGEFESVKMVYHGTGTVIDEVFYDPNGNGTYSVSTPGCATGHDVVVQ
jgi:hypothetical protein